MVRVLDHFPPMQAPENKRQTRFRKGDAGEAGSVKQKKQTIPPKENLTPNEIRARVRAKFGEKKMISTDAVEKEEFRTDLDAETAQDRASKLKKALSENAFDFSERERKVLDQILRK